ncbi:MAG: ribonuclease H-like domain-containing protein [Nitrospira sp.]
MSSGVVSGHRNGLLWRDHRRGCYGHGRFTAFVRGESLVARDLADELSQYDLLVTFCGTTFDVPMLLAHYPGLPLDQPHIDLCFLGRRLGYRGGLKAIEAQLDIPRAVDLHGLRGQDAVLLWNRWQHSHDEHAGAQLLGYNEADCVNLERLGDTFSSAARRHALSLSGDKK